LNLRKRYKWTKYLLYLCRIFFVFNIDIMKLKYNLGEEDFLAFQLFVSSKSARIQKKKKRNWLLLSLGSFVLALYFYSRSNYVMVVYFGLVAVMFGLFYNKYFNWRYKKHFVNVIKENYGDRIKVEDSEIEITEEYLKTKDRTGEAKIFIKEIKEVTETRNHFFVNISSGVSLIIPKKKIEHVSQVKQQLVNLDIPVIDELTWKWS